MQSHRTHGLEPLQVDVDGVPARQIGPPPRAQRRRGGGRQHRRRSSTSSAPPGPKRSEQERQRTIGEESLQWTGTAYITGRPHDVRHKVPDTHDAHSPRVIRPCRSPRGNTPVARRRQPAISMGAIGAEKLEWAGIACIIGDASRYSTRGPRCARRPLTSAHSPLSQPSRQRARCALAQPAGKTKMAIGRGGAEGDGGRGRSGGRLLEPLFC